MEKKALNFETFQSPDSLLAKPLEVIVGERKFKFKEYGIGRPPEGGVVSPGNMETGSLAEVHRFYGDQPALVNRYLPGVIDLPYTFLAYDGKNVFGNYTTPTGQDEFKDSDLIITPEGFNPPDWARELWQFGRLKNRKKFNLDSELACLRDLQIRDGHLVFVVGQGFYSESFYSNGMEGLSFGLSAQEKERLIGVVSPSELATLEKLDQDFEKKYGKNSTIRAAIFSHQERLPEFSEQIHNNSIGVAGMVLSHDQEFIFVKRGENVSVNQGINCTASGAAEFNQEALSRFGLPVVLGKEMDNEARAELGLNAGSLLLGSIKEKVKLELGLGVEDYEIIPLGFIRELPRGGKPECMFLIKTFDDTAGVVDKIRRNTHSDKKEIEGSVYALAAEEASALVATKAANHPIQHKGLVNLALAVEYLRNN